MPCDYTNSRIYRLVCNDTGKCYYGSTTTTLGERLSGHKSSFTRWQEGKYHYVTSFEIIEGGNWKMELVEECDGITTKEQLHARERFYIENNECVNKVVPSRTPTESQAAYYQAHKAERKAYEAAYREAHKAEKKAYDAANADKIRARRAEKVRCPNCGGTATRGHLPRHQRSNKCLSAQEK